MRIGGGTLLILWLTFAGAEAASAAPRPALRISGAKDACPAPEQLAAALGQLLYRHDVTLDPARAAMLEAQIVDLGASYRVSLGASARELIDETRSCAERASAAAVYLALVAEPPALQQRPPPPPPPVPDHRPRSRYPMVGLDLAGLVEAAPRTGDGLVAGGGSLRVWVSGRYVGGSIAASGLSPVTLALDVAAARIVRVPIDLALHATLRRSWFEAVGDLGLRLTVLRFEGQGLATNHSGIAVEPGLSLALGARFWVSARVAPYLAFNLAVVPRPPDLSVEPVGIIGKMPYIWLGGALGLAVRIR